MVANLLVRLWHWMFVPPPSSTANLDGLTPIGRGFGTSVAGTSHDGHTEIIVRKCRKGDSLTLRRERNNRFDANAVAIDLLSGQCIGYLTREDAAKIGPAIDSGRIFAASISSLHGAANPKSRSKNAGVNILVKEYKA